MKKPILLPTNKSSIFIHKGGDLCYNTTGEREKTEFCLLQHLHIIDTEAEIKEGDWFIDKSDNLVKQSKGYGVAIGVDVKVICSSDELLNLPLINEEFVRLYVQKQGKIDEVNCEIRQGELISLGSDGTGKNFHEDDYAIVTFKYWRRAGKIALLMSYVGMLPKVQMLILITVSPPFANILLAAVFRQAIT